MKAAKDLAHSTMSKAIESGLRRSLQKAYARKAVERGVGIDQVEKAEGTFCESDLEYGEETRCPRRGELLPHAIEIIIE